MDTRLPDGARRYLVGGVVRDELLGLPARDRDWVVVGTTPESMQRAGFLPVGKDFPVFLHPETREEHALARTERKTAPGYKGFVFHADADVTIEQDLARRDLTINAMARDEDGSLIDPFDGQADIDARQLRHVSEAFVEDPVRLLRVAKFAARLEGFTVASDTRAVLEHMVDGGEIDALVPERVWQEMHDALRASRPGAFFEVLRDCGALKKLFPEVDRLFGVPQPEKWHPEIDTGVHTLMVLEQIARLTDAIEPRFAALAHDFGKGTTPRQHWPSHRGHEERGVKLIEAFCQRWRVPNDCRELAVLVSRWHTHVHKAFEIRPDTALKVIEAVGGFRHPGRFEQFLLACEADARGRTGLEDRDYPQAGRFRQALAAAAPVSAADVSSDLEGKAIGEAIRHQRLNAIKGVW